MHWLFDVIVLLFVGLMIYNGIKKGFLNTTFTLVTALLALALAGGLAFALLYFLLRPFGLMQDVQIAFLGFAQSLDFILSLVGIAPIDFALYLGYAVMGVFLFIPLYIFMLWVLKQFERFIKFCRAKSVAFRVIGSVIGGVVNFAIAGVVVLGLFWLMSAVDGSGLFGYTNEVMRAAPISGLIYEYNPLCSFLGGHGVLAESVANIISGNFLMR